MTTLAVLFDLDDTLYDEITFVQGAMFEVAGFLAGRLGHEAREIHSRLLAELERSGRGHVFDAVLAELGLSTVLVPTLVYVYRSARPTLQLFPDAATLLDQLDEQGVATGVLTDGTALVQGAKVDLLGLREQMDAVVLTDAIGHGHPKPDPLGFQVATELLSLPPERVLYVANDLRKDFEGPRRIGMPTIHVTRHQLGRMGDLLPHQRPTTTVETLADVWPHVLANMEEEEADGDRR